MTPIERMKLRMGVNGSTPKDFLISTSKAILAKQFENDVSYQDTYSYWDTKDELLPIRVYNRKFSNSSGWTEDFTTQIENPVLVGDILYNSKEDKYYLCTESYNKDEIQYTGKLSQCNSYLKWQNSYGKILEYPCVKLTDSLGIEQTNVLMLGATKTSSVYVSFNEDTVLIDKNYRFFLDKNTISPTPFKVLGNDTTTYNYDKGLCRLTLEEDTIAEDDRSDLWICNYKDIPYVAPITTTTVSDIDSNDIDSNDIDTTISNELTSKIKYKGNCQIRIGGNAKTFKANFYQGEELLDNIIPIWDYEIDSDIEQMVSISIEDNVLKIKASDKLELKGRKIVLIVTDSNGEAKSTLDVTFTSGV